MSGECKICHEYCLDCKCGVQKLECTFEQEVDQLEEYMKKIWDKVEVDQKFELQKLERLEMPDCMRKKVDDFLEANGVSQ